MLTLITEGEAIKLLSSLGASSDFSLKFQNISVILTQEVLGHSGASTLDLNMECTEMLTTVTSLFKTICKISLPTKHSIVQLYIFYLFFIRKKHQIILLL